MAAPDQELINEVEQKTGLSGSDAYNAAKLISDASSGFMEHHVVNNGGQGLKMPVKIFKGGIWEPINYKLNIAQGDVSEKAIAKALVGLLSIPALEAGTLEGLAWMTTMQTRIDHIYPCTSPLFLKEVKYYKEFVHWAYMTPNSSYKTLPKRRRKTYDFLLENSPGLYYRAKYVCEIPFEYMTKHERSLDPKYREKLMRGNEEYEGIKIIREMQKELKKQGENHGR